MNETVPNLRAVGEPDPEFKRPPAFSDEALALRFANRHKNDLRYVAVWDRWLIWDGARWREDDTRKALDLSRTICREAAAEANKAAKAVASAKTVRAVEFMAKADRRLAARVSDWDADPWMLNTPRGVVNLITGDLKPHSAGDLMTKIAAVAPGGDCPLWHKFLARVTAGDDELKRFLQRLVGYCLTGSTREHAMVFLYGTGANGKSVFLYTITGILGDYAATAPMETFTISRNERHPTELAALQGARMVAATETEEGRRWAEAKIKAITGGDPITARYMRQDFFTFKPQLKLIVAGNHKPALRNVDEAIRRRMHLIPFTVTIPEGERDETLPLALKEEWPGILQWAIEGCLDWQECGLAAPDVVRSATEEYLEAEDTITRWIDERCHTLPTCEVQSSKLYADWKNWADQAGEYPGSQRRFTQMLEDRGYRRERRTQARVFIGIALK